GLPELLAPLSQPRTPLLPLLHVPRAAGRRRKYEALSLSGRDLASGLPRPNEAREHGPGEWNVECPMLATLRLRDVQRATPHVEMPPLRLRQGLGSGARQKSEQVELAANGIRERSELPEPLSQLGVVHAVLRPILAVEADNLAPRHHRQRAVELRLRVIVEPP